MITDTHKDSIINTGYLGLLPFFLGALGPWVLIQYESWFVNFFINYALIILGFMAGCTWILGAFGIANRSKAASTLGLSVIAIMLIASVTPLIASASLLALGFFILWAGEKLLLTETYPDWYQQLRHKLTWVVIACHMLCIWNIIGNH